MEYIPTNRGYSKYFFLLIKDLFLREENEGRISENFGVLVTRTMAS